VKRLAPPKVGNTAKFSFAGAAIAPGTNPAEGHPPTRLAGPTAAARRTQNTSGQRDENKYSRHASSVAKRFWNSKIDRG
jgi:hypothetical protein